MSCLLLQLPDFLLRAEQSHRHHGSVFVLLMLNWSIAILLELTYETFAHVGMDTP